MREICKKIFMASLFAFFVSMLSLQAGGEEKASVGQCPKTKVVGKVDDCFRCHVPVSFKLKQPDPCEGIKIPSSSVFVKCAESKPVELTWYLSAIDSDEAEKIFRWAREQGLKKLVIEIQSPGGSLFEAWRIVGIIKQNESEGIQVETRCNGFAASAGFLILVSGTKGHRYAAKTAHLMWHELMSLSLFRIDTPSSSEETSRTLRKLQDIANTWLSEVSCMSKEQLDDAIKNKSFWMTGQEAKRFCFVDHVIN